MFTALRHKRFFEIGCAILSGDTKRNGVWSYARDLWNY